MPASKIISVFSPKGGSGKTIIATNLAVALSQLNKKILLLDFDLKAPLDLAKTLNFSPKFSLCDIIPVIDQEPMAVESEIKEKLLTYSPYMVYLPAITKVKQLAHITPEVLKKFFAIVKDKYDFIIIDSGSDFTDPLIATFDQANLIMMVITPDILSVYKTEWCMDTLQSLRFPMNMVKVVLNRAESKGSVSWQEIKIVIPNEIIAKIPSEGKAVNLALNRGIPVIVDSPTCKFSLAINDLAKDLNERNDIFIQHLPEERAKLKEEMSAPSIWQQEGHIEPLRERDTGEMDDEIIRLKRKVHKRLIEELDLEHVSHDSTTMSSQKIKELREKVERSITNLLAEETGKFISSLEVRQKLVREMADEALGLGPLEDLVKDNSVTEIMVNNRDQIYIEQAGKIYLTTKKFVTDEQIRITIERIIAPLGRRIDESTPMVDARLLDGSRVNAIIPPLALSGPTLTIRKFSKHKLQVDELVQKHNSLSHAMATFLEACVRVRLNIIVSGGTDSGKTTFLNILSEFIPSGERVITIEDSAELKLHHTHWIRLESRPPNIEGKGAITIRELFRNTLRMRPDRIIVGEVRGGEVLDMLQAMNTGHDGSMSTVHANTTRDVLMRFDSMILMSGVELPMRAIREMISSAINLIVATARMADGSRKVIQITEMCGMDEDERIIMKDIFLFEQTGVDVNGKVIGEYRPTGYIPTFLKKMQVSGLVISEDLFKPVK